MSAPYVPAEATQNQPRPRRRVPAYVLAVVVACASAGCTQTPATPPAAEALASATTDEATGTLHALADAVQRGDDSVAARLAADARTRRALVAATSNAGLLGLDEIELVPSASAEQVQLTWSPPDPAAAPLTLRMPLAVSGKRIRLTHGAGYDGLRLPVWWQGPVSVASSADVGVVVRGSRAAARRWLQLAQAARARLSARLDLTQHRGRVWFEVVPDEVSLDLALGATPGSYAGVAAVATAADGSRDSSADVRVLVAAAPMRTMTSLGQRTVLTHELVHLFSGDAWADAAELPVWFVEGRADWLALPAGAAARAEAASVLVTELRHGQGWRGLPRSRDFVPGAPRFDSAYEASLQACAALVDLVGAPGLHQVNRSLRRGHTMAQALRGAGTDRRALINRFRQRLQDLTR